MSAHDKPAEGKARVALGEALRAARGSRTQRAVANGAGVSVAFISQTESSMLIPSVDVLRRIVGVMGGDVATFERLAEAAVVERWRCGVPSGDRATVRGVPKGTDTWAVHATRNGGAS